MSALTDLIAAVDALLDDSAVYNAIVHGPASGVGSTVTTDSGEVKTFAKAIADFETAGLETMLTVLGIPSYSDLTAANTALPANAIFYNEALEKLDITTA